MKKQITKAVSSILLAAMLLTAATSPAMALETEPQPTQPIVREYSISPDDGVSPLFDLIDFMMAVVDVQDGTVVYNGVAMMIDSSTKFTYTLRMEKSKDEKSWSKVTEFSNSAEYCVGEAFPNGSYKNAPKGYFYRTVFTVRAFDGKLVEKVTATSPSYDYR